MAGNGPPPNPSAKRRNARVGLVVLPAKGRPGRTPNWSLPDSPNQTARIKMLIETIDELEQLEHEAGLGEGTFSRAEATRLTRTREKLAVAREVLEVTRETEKTLWRKLWKTPQAIEWERLMWDRDVAQYVRWKVMAELGDLAAGRESRMYADGLGLTPKGMKSLMWTIAVDELTVKRNDKQTAAATGTDGAVVAGPWGDLSAVDPEGT